METVCIGLLTLKSFRHRAWGWEERLPNHFSTGNLSLRYSGVNLFMKGRVTVLCVFQLCIPCFTCTEVLLKLSSCSVDRLSHNRLNINCGFIIFCFYFFNVMTKGNHAGFICTGSSCKIGLGNHNILECSQKVTVWQSFMLSFVQFTVHQPVAPTEFSAPHCCTLVNI